MESFTEAERAFLRGQSCCRLVTLGSDGAPEVSAVLYQMQGDLLVAGGLDLSDTPAWAVVRGGGPVVVVVDEIVPGVPPRSRGVRLEVAATLDDSRARPVFRLRPTAVRSWGLAVAGLRP